MFFILFGLPESLVGLPPRYFVGLFAYLVGEFLFNRLGDSLLNSAIETFRLLLDFLLGDFFIKLILFIEPLPTFILFLLN